MNRRTGATLGNVERDDDGFHNLSAIFKPGDHPDDSNESEMEEMYLEQTANLDIKSTRKSIRLEQSDGGDYFDDDEDITVHTGPFFI